MTYRLAHPPDKLPDKLIDAETWIFDLDNTLYPPSFDLFSHIDIRMRTYIAAYLKTDHEEAHRIQKKYFHEYGASLRGLMECHDMPPQPFLEYVHEIDLSPIKPSPALGEVLSALKGDKLVFTNGSEKHALRVLDRLGISSHFEAIFDIARADYYPKPKMDTYQKMIKRHGVNPKEAVMVDDLSRNLQPAAELGMTTVWVSEENDEFQKGNSPCHDHVSFHVQNLLVWLQALVKTA